jgi:flagellar M-ring protein FliF
VAEVSEISEPLRPGFRLGRQVVLFIVGFAVIAAVLVGLYFLYFQDRYSTLFSNMRPNDAATVVAELERRKMAYRLGDGGRTILVPEAKVDGARLDILGSDLPLKGTVGFELFNKTDMGLTEFAQKINYQRALQGELARTIMALDGISAARVHLTLSDPGLFRAEKLPSKAAVTLELQPARTPNPKLLDGIRRVVAASVPDLVESNVVVMDSRGDLLGDPPAVVPPSPIAQQKQAIELFYAGRVRQALMRRTDKSVGVTVLAKIAPFFLATVTPPSPARAEGAANVVDTLSTAFSPTARTFPLSVTLTGAADEDPALINGLVEEARQAIAFDATRGDAIMTAFVPQATRMVPPPLPAAASPAIAVGSQGWASDGQIPGWPDWGWPVIGIVCAFAFGLWAIRRLRAPLPVAARQKLADRLTALTSVKEADATATG